MTSESPRYRDAGVCPEAGDQVVRRAADFARQTRSALAQHNAELLAGIGGFAAAVQLPKLQNPVVVAATDGVGTKLEPLLKAGRAEVAGADLVAMCVNDIICQGARPLFFLDYYACGKLNPESAARFLSGVADGCAAANCALVGGETAEMPGVYPPDGMDAAGFAVGLAERDELFRAGAVRAGNKIVGVASSGPHSNGFSLIRAIMKSAGPSVPPKDENESALLDSILAPTRIYVRPFAALRENIRVLAAAHITGGGLVGNIPRALPPELGAKLFCDSWPRPQVFRFLQEAGEVSEDEMRRVFNCGIGLAIVVESADADSAISVLEGAGERAFVVGEVVANEKNAGGGGGGGAKK